RPAQPCEGIVRGRIVQRDDPRDRLAAFRDDEHAPPARHFVDEPKAMGLELGDRDRLAHRPFVTAPWSSVNGQTRTAPPARSPTGLGGWHLDAHQLEHHDASMRTTLTL